MCRECGGCGLMAFSAGCADGTGEAAGTSVVAASVAGTPVKVEVRKTADGKWELLRDGKPYFVKGVGGDYSRAVLKVLVADGGNSIRLWGVDANTRKDLDEAGKQGLTVVLGYWVGHKADGFPADDPAIVNRQLEEFKQVVQTYRNDPAVLVWGIGNEMESGKGNEHAGVVGIDRGPGESRPQAGSKSSDDDRDRRGWRPLGDEHTQILPGH